MKLLTFTFALLCATPLAAQSTIERLVAVADASADADQPSANFGSALLVTSGKTFSSTPTFRVWLTRGHYLFDLSGVAGRPLPTRARLRVYQEQASAAGCLDVSVYRATQAWSEATLTWQTKPALGPTALASACVGDSFDLGWKSFDVTPLVQQWLQGVVPNHGLVIRDPSESLAGAARPLHATSRESANAAFHPHLELAWGTQHYGAGCGTSRSGPALDLYAGSPVIGGGYVLLASGLPGGRPVFHWLGLSDAIWNGVPLPLDLSPLGFGGCAILASLELELPSVTTDNRGRARIAIAIPAQPFLRGRRVYHQALAIDTSSNLYLTNGFAIHTY